MLIDTIPKRAARPPATYPDYMPAKSKKQQQAAGAALSAKRGERGKSALKGASKSMYDSMSQKELKKMASTKRKGKPERKTKKS